ncbi:MAG TPA: ABC transporter permease [Chloroflexi bacterium]|nr:ABC transporter permease [Chloroflexota bacterium]
MRVRKSKSMLVGGILLSLIILAATVGLAFPPYDPLAMDVSHRLLPPSFAHPFGTDQYGRDIFSRVLRASEIALGVSVVSVGIALLAGVPLGFMAGFYGGVLDEVVMRFMDGLYAFPAILLAIAIVAVLGPGPINAMIAIGVVNIPIFARLARGSILSVKEREYVLAAQALGCTRTRILWRHILPNGISPLIIQASISAATAVLAEASLSYLGLGTQPPYPSWGRMLEEARLFMDRAPWMVVFPGLAIAITVLGFNFLGDGLRDVLDPWKSIG